MSLVVDCACDLTTLALTDFDTPPLPSQITLDWRQLKDMFMGISSAPPDGVLSGFCNGSPPRNALYVLPAVPFFLIFSPQKPRHTTPARSVLLLLGGGYNPLETVDFF